MSVSSITQIDTPSKTFTPSAPGIIAGSAINLFLNSTSAQHRRMIFCIVFSEVVIFSPFSISQVRVDLVDLLPHVVFVVFAQPAPAMDHVFGNGGGLPAMERIGTVYITGMRHVTVKASAAAQIPCPAGRAADFPPPPGGNR